ncbi:helix-turn-helix domain-containing protein [Actinokineospora cianjurensis]|uniref:Transcriptional regulator with XRE-family HTH domain n=1 Tax=Actinokineospora cianjurensis TaxID=585224 RepID=A0A421AWN6_9PSEU|nr:helix-turn-helix transcriptional regulator [Actinokineospora cianjurensis]RLK54192.1 transcriptional regulator with XRE-family HTH domain [Actinokineospora cianjurensis]
MSRRAFGAALRQARLAAGLSLAELARQVHYTKGHLSKIENGHKQATVALARRCDQVLHARGTLSALAPSSEAEQAPNQETPAGNAIAALAPWQPTTAGLHGEHAFPAPQPWGSATASTDHRGAADGLAVVLDQLRVLGRSLAPHLILPMLVPQVGVLGGLAGEAAAGDRTRLLTLAARGAEFAGWMTQEAGDHVGAGQWTRRAADLALHAGDRDMVAYCLVRDAELRLYDSDGRSTVELTTAVRGFDGVRPRTRALAAHREAQGHALVGAARQCHEALARAEELWAQSNEDAVALGSTTVTDLGSAVAGWCAFDLGDLDRAIELLGVGLAGIPPSSPRIRALFGTRLALAHEAAGEFAEAERLARSVLDVVPAIRSATVRSQLLQLASALRRHSHSPGALTLRADLADALRVEPVHR